MHGTRDLELVEQHQISPRAVLMSKWESREALAAAVADYQTNWWRSDPNALAIIEDGATHPGLRGQILATHALNEIVTTAAVYRPTHPGASDDRPYAPARELLHERIAADCVASAGSGSERPAAFFTIGCPGAGKTSILRDIVDQYRRSAAIDGQPGPISIIDADYVRQSLPEYADGLGAFVVAQECYDITYGKVFDRAVESRADVVYDTIGRLSSIRENVDLLRANAYEIHVLLALSPLDLCLERTEQRALNIDGRLVHPGILQGAANDAEQAIGALVSEGTAIAGWAKIDTTDMSIPVLIEGSSQWTEILSVDTGAET